MHDHTPHERYEDDLAAYLLDALGADETREFEHHLATCGRCQAQERWLRGSVDMLPSSVEQLTPPPELRERLMETVRREAAEDSREFDAPQRARRWAVPFSLRPAMAVAGVLVVLAAGIVGYAIGTGGGDDTATIEAEATPQAPRGVRATLERDGDRGTLRVEGLPQKRDSVYEVWLARKGRFEPSSLLQVDSNGSGAAAIADGLEEADEVLVTLEPPGGSAQPTSDPLLRAPV